MFRTSLKAIVGLCASEDGKLCATISEGGEGRIFDVLTFGELYVVHSCQTWQLTLENVDMTGILKLSYTPKACCWVHQPGAGQTLLAISDSDSPTIRIYDGRGDGKPLYELGKLHRAAVHLIAVKPYLPSLCPG